MDDVSYCPHRTTGDLGEVAISEWSNIQTTQLTQPRFFGDPEEGESQYTSIYPLLHN